MNMPAHGGIPHSNAGAGTRTSDQSPGFLARELRSALAEIAATPTDPGPHPQLLRAQRMADRLAELLPCPQKTTGQIDLARLLFDLQRQWSGFSGNGSLRFSLRLDSDLPDTLPGDAAMLGTVLSALLHHCYSTGGIRQIALTLTTQEDSWLVFLFGGDGTRTVAGAGDTLAEGDLTDIRELCRAIGARLDLNRSPGKATVLRCAVPLTGPPPASSEHKNGARMSIDPPDSLLDIDETVFTHLLELAGPELAKDLVARFQEDLAEVERQIATALPRNDLDEMRAASHVLIALSGTAGARQLQKDARSYNGLAHRTDTPDMTGPSQKILTQIAALIAFLGALPTSQGQTG